MEKINLNNENEQAGKEEKLVQDPLAVLWGNFAEMAPTGAMDSEHDTFNKIQASFLRGEISGEDVVRISTEIKDRRMNDH